LTRYGSSGVTALAVAAAGIALLGTLPVAPAAAGTVQNGCIQDTAGFNLNCTSNDVSVAGVARDASGDPLLEILDNGCAYPGDTVDFSATFDVVLNAQARYDIGIYFATDGGGTDGAMTGSCSITTMDAANTGAQFVQLDGAPDTCGDIDAAHSPLHPTITVTGVKCEDKNGDGLLDFPNCISWRQPGSNETCTDPTSAYPGAPSKCKCDAGFTVPIKVPAATIEVIKDASRSSVPESGAAVTYTVTVKNMGIDPNNPFYMNELEDNLFGDLNGQGTCSVPQKIEQGGTPYTCSFTKPISGKPGSNHVNVIRASGMDSRGNSASDSDDATVAITGIEPTISVVKTASPKQLMEPGGMVTYTVTVTNTSGAWDPIKIYKIEDDKFGLIDAISGSTCNSIDNPYPTALAAGKTYTCRFSKSITGNAGYEHTNTVTAYAVDDDDRPASNSDSETVTINNSLSEISVTKTPSPKSLPEPGGLVTYSVVVVNLSTVDTVTIDTLADDMFGDLNGKGSCSVPQTISKGGQYACSFSESLTGNAGDTHTNVITASGKDDDSDPVSGSDSALVNFTNVPPAAKLKKTVTSVVATYEVTVTNESAAEGAELISLTDDQFGDITDASNSALESTDCRATSLAPKGQEGDTYTCSFSAVVTTSPHTNVVTGSVSDDEGGFVDPAPNDSASVTFN